MKKLLLELPIKQGTKSNHFRKTETLFTTIDILDSETLDPKFPTIKLYHQ